MITENDDLRRAADLLERALRGQDEDLLNDAFGKLRDALDGNVRPSSCVDVGPRLAGLLPRVPLGAAAILAVMIGACVENGAAPSDCSGAILDGVREALGDAARFPALWAETVGGELPERGHHTLDHVLGQVAAVGGMDAPRFAAVSAWVQLPLWEMAAGAVLAYDGIRRQVQADGTLVALADAVAVGDADLKCLRYLLKMFDGEALVVLHRPSGTGYRMRVHGIGDNFQLHTLIGHLLIGGGHIAGDPPSAEAVAAARDAVPDGRIATTGAFNLSGADGAWIWNEGCPADIPLVEGERVLVLDPPTYGRTWNAGRFYPRIPGDLTLEAVLTPADAKAYLERVAPPRQWPTGN